MRVTIVNFIKIIKNIDRNYLYCYNLIKIEPGCIMKIILIRHGKTKGNIYRRYIGKTDEHLYEYDSISGVYPNADFIVVSPMKRCIETAKFIYPRKKYNAFEGLRECDFGIFENKSFEDLKNNDLYKRWMESNGMMPFPEGEAHDVFKKRCIDAYKKAIGIAGDKNIAFIIHGGTIMAIMQFIFGGDFYDYQVKNGDGFVIENNTYSKISDWRGNNGVT